MSNPSTSTLGQRERLLSLGAMRAFVLVTGLFFLWGIPNNLNDVLIRPFMKSLGVSLMMIIIGGAVGTPLMGFIAEQTHNTAISDCFPLLGYIEVGSFSLYMNGYMRKQHSMTRR